MRKVLYAFFLTLASCTNIDCPLDNVVVMTSGFYRSEDNSALKVEEEFTLTSGDGNYILINREPGVTGFQIPLRQGIGSDTLLLWFSNKIGQFAADSLFLTYSDSPHFESVDCPAALFHTLKEVRWTSHPLAELPLTVDHVEIVRSLVNYDDVENLKIYLRSTAQ